MFDAAIFQSAISCQTIRSDSVGHPLYCWFTLICIWLIPQICANFRVSASWIPLLFFICFAIISTLLANYLDIPFARNINPIRENIEAVVTVIIGVSIFALSSSFLRHENDFKFTMRLLNLGAILMIIWSMMQLIAWYGFHEYPKWMFEIQGLSHVGSSSDHELPVCSRAFLVGEYAQFAIYPFMVSRNREKVLML